MLGAAFDDVAAEGAARWRLDSTLADPSVLLTEDERRRDRLAAVLARLKEMTA